MSDELNDGNKNCEGLVDVSSDPDGDTPAGVIIPTDGMDDGASLDSVSLVPDGASFPSTDTGESLLGI